MRKFSDWMEILSDISEILSVVLTTTDGELQPYVRPGASLAGVAASGMAGRKPFTFGTWKICFFCAPVDDDDVLEAGATIRGM